MTVLSTFADARKLTGTVVVIDVFRFSNTAISLLSRGAARVLPIESEAAARRVKADHPDWLVLGERDGVMLDGFDGDNSPTQELPVSGRTVAVTTSNGTRCLAACPPDRNVLIGSFANASAVADALAGLAAEDVSFWAAGRKQSVAADEDILGARYLQSLLQGTVPEFTAIQRALLNCPGARRLRDHGHHADLDYCVALDSETVVPRRVDDGGLWSLVA